MWIINVRLMVVELVSKFLTFCRVAAGDSKSNFTNPFNCVVAGLVHKGGKEVWNYRCGMVDFRVKLDGEDAGGSTYITDELVEDGGEVDQ
jgi:hypothetical protein